MTNGYNIIADIAGRYDELLLLLAKMPQNATLISLGDMVDRHDQSKQVVEFFMNNGKAILGNHEHLLLDFCRSRAYYDTDVWMYNGGRATLQSFDPEEKFRAKDAIPENVLQWLESLPLYMEVEGCLISHSFIKPGMTLEESLKLGNCIEDVGETKIIWNRRNPVRRDEYKLQIAGHNSQMGLKWFEDEKGKFAVCLDDSRKKKLTGIHLPSMETYQVDYL